ncbi:hypothetical protein CHARACLAT_020478 [Characodon lateralis]|uniref:CH-like domain-containing protein n=1 Tax=Characodon lateralis TaxID=208331 RepID=A0ABU7DKE2_9TELE|nr:hypothetical protein [Characodon lateralis]
MSAILCRWLNHELRLSESVDPRNFARDFSNGYLFGEILHKYQMQEDFNMFLKNELEASYSMMLPPDISSWVWCVQGDVHCSFSASPGILLIFTLYSLRSHLTRAPSSTCLLCNPHRLS